MTGIARLLIHLSALLVPRDTRARWREEWLAETSDYERRRPRSHVLWRTCGAPWDALLLRFQSLSAAGLRSGWRADIVQTWRVLRREPWHALVVALCLGTGITAAVTTFSVVNAMLYGALPGVQDRATLAELHLRETGRAAHFKAISAADYEVLKTHAPPDVVLTASSDIRSRGDRIHLALRAGDDSIPIVGQFVAGNFFEVLGTVPARGRLMSAGDDTRDGLIAVIGHRFWQVQLGGVPDVIGSIVTVSGQAVRVVGVAPPGFAGGMLREPDEGAAPELWLPLATRRLWPVGPEAFVTVLVRHSPATSLEAAEAALGPVVRQLPLRTGVDSMHPLLRPLGHARDGSDAELALLLAIVLAGPLTVVAIGCANVANLRLARASARTRELAVRLSLGATRSQLVRLLLLEATALTAIATAAGWAGAQFLINTTASALEPVLPVAPVLDMRVLAFAAGLMLGVVLLSGFAPAWLATRRLVSYGLRETPQSGGRAHGRLRHTLVAAQIALSLALLVVAALFTRSLQSLVGTPAPLMQQLLVARVDPSRFGDDPASAARLADTLVERLRADGRVRAVGVAYAGLFDRSEGTFRRPGDATDRSRLVATIQHVSPEWFRALDLQTTGGRTFNSSDRNASVAVVNQTLATLLAAGGSALGTSLIVGRDSAPVTIVGVVSDGPQAPGQTESARAIYLPFPGSVASAASSAGPRFGERTSAPATARPFTVFIRANDPGSLAADFRRLVTAVEPRAPWTKVDTALALVSAETSPIRIVAASFSGLGVTALLLAATGLYAVMAYVVSLRRREIGIRMAIGARPGDVVSLVLRQTLRLVCWGMAAGLLLSIPTSYALRSTLVGVSFIDPVSLLPVLGIMLMVSLVAAIVPARRAAGVDPVAALRAE